MCEMDCVSGFLVARSSVVHIRQPRHVFSALAMSLSSTDAALEALRRTHAAYRRARELAEQPIALPSTPLQRRSNEAHATPSGSQSTVAKFIASGLGLG